VSLARMVPAAGRAGRARAWPAPAVLALSVGLWAASLVLGLGHGPVEPTTASLWLRRER
jgi:hypothetical protein